MELKKDGLITRFYRNAYFIKEGDETTNFCGFFWAVFFAVPCLLFTWWTYIKPANRYLHKVRYVDFGTRLGFGFAGQALTILLIFIGISVVQGIIAHPLAALLTVLIFVAIATGVYFFVKDDSAVANFAGEATDIVIEKIKSVKEGYCPKIEWKSKNS